MTDKRFEKRTCPHCKKIFRPAGLGAHLKMREQIGHCPTKVPYPKRKKRKGSVYEWDHRDNSKGRWTQLEDMENQT